MSAPATNARSPPPRRTIARTSASASSASISASSSSSRAADSAFIGGLSIVTSATASRRSVETKVLMLFSTGVADANCSRSAVLRNLPTAVFGISSTYSNRSGSQNFANDGARKSRSSPSDADAPSRSTTTASGRSDHLSSGTAITAASATAGCPISAFSRATVEIHSPPDLTRSFERSWISTYPSAPIVTMSPVRNQPSSVQRSAASGAS